MVSLPTVYRRVSFIGADHFVLILAVPSPDSYGDFFDLITRLFCSLCQASFLDWRILDLGQVRPVTPPRLAHDRRGPL